MNSFRSLLPALLLIFVVSCSTTQNQTAPSATAYSSNPWEIVSIPEWYNPADYDTISVVTWNLEHFVDQYDNPYIDNERENSPDSNMAERRKLLAVAIEELDADIVVFQEVESAAFVEAWAEEQVEEMGYRLFTGRESNDWYMNVVVMSRLPLGMLYSYANIFTPIEGETNDDGNPARQHFTNNRLVSVDVIVNPEYSFTLTGVHLKAGRGERNEGWRIGQVDLLRSHYSQILSTNSSANILFTGDLNMQPGDREYNRLLGAETGVVFVDPMADEESLTHPADNPARQLDYIIPNEQMMERLVPGSAEVAMPMDRESMRLISDHLPVIARFVTVND
ncbi:MAG: endonuclease/exonuclease/phosphatase family protein [Balneolaceae bacterium]